MTEIERLKTVVEKLRSETGCPWDRAQTHESLKAPVVEEAAELICGINILERTGDPANLKEELGDLLLQVIFHAVLAQEEGLFTLEDVAKTASEKMIRRHPHVFSGVRYASDEERDAAWAAIKEAEKQGREWESAYLEEAMKETAELIERAKARKGFAHREIVPEAPPEREFGAFGIGKRILVLGCPGSGKSTFSRRLQAATGLPLVYLDMVWWRPDRSHISREEFDRRLASILARERWILDGNYSRTYESRIRACDTVIFLDFSEEVCLAGIRDRLGSVRPDMPWIEREPDPELEAMVRSYRTENRPKLLALLEQYPDRRVLCFRSREEADGWMRALEGARSQ